MKHRIPIFITLIFLSFSVAFAQSSENEPYFRSPLDIPLYLAGNFGEIRSNHFHGGLDIKTQSVVGHKVYSVADGYVSRIKVSAWGYGRTLYITHPNGYISVYAHLSVYSGKIEEYVKDQQYKKQRYSIELFPYKNQLVLTKGEVIALSGNTGGSSGPHLHFELRSDITGNPINPLLYGFEIKDSLKPVVKAVRIYPINKNSHVNHMPIARYYAIAGAKGNYRLRSENPIEVYGEIGFGVEVYDFLNGSHNKCGIYSIELQLDGTTIYYHEIKTYGFHEDRYINAHIDYREFRKNGRHVQKSFIVPNNKLSLYKKTLNRGIMNLTDGKVHDLKYIIKDSYGNTSIVAMQVLAREKMDEPSLADTIASDLNKNLADDLIKAISNPLSNNVNANAGGKEANIPVSIYLASMDLDSASMSPNFVKQFKYPIENTYETENIKISLPAYYLYDDLMFEYKMTDTMINAIAPTHHIHNSYVPVHSYYNISLKTGHIKPHLRDKAMVASVRGGRTYYLGGTYANEFVSTRTKRFGAFTVVLDTIPPRIKAINIYHGKNMSRTQNIKVRLYDSLSGIKSYRATIDGKWILMSYEPKNSMMTFSFNDWDRLELDSDPDGSKTTHKLKVQVTDNRGNTSRFSLDFIR